MEKKKPTFRYFITDGKTSINIDDLPEETVDKYRKAVPEKLADALMHQLGYERVPEEEAKNITDAVPIEELLKRKRTTA